MASGNDIKAAEQTYGSFITLLKWGTLAAALATAFVVLLLAS